VRRRQKLPTWVPVALAAALAFGIYGLWVRPTQGRIAVAEQQLRQARQQAASLEAQILSDRAVPPAPLPVTKAAFDRLWPDVVARAQAAGYALQAVTFAAAPPLAPAGATGSSGPPAPEQGPTGAGEPEGTATLGPATPLEITARFTGRYLPLDETLSRMRGVLPLWSWRSIHISAQQGNAEIAITVDGVVPVEGRIAGTRGPAVRRPSPALPPPPLPGKRP
jgi:hypothetical protein